MSKFPVENTDIEGIGDAVNYLLSGPSGLGQNFAGFSSYQPGWLTGNYRIPYGKDFTQVLYVAPISLGTVQMLDARTIKLTFASAQATPPFDLGNGVTASGISTEYDSYINDGGYQIGVVECTTTYVIIRLVSDQPLLATTSGGSLTLTVMRPIGDGFFNSTDCNARVTVTGGTDRVFISSQLDQVISYTATGTASLKVTLAVNRYIGTPNNNPTNPDFLFNLDETVAQKVYTIPGLTGTGTTSLETIFSTVIDQPAPAYYWYILEIQFESDDTIQVTSDEFDLRSLSAQVVKQ